MNSKTIAFVISGLCLSLLAVAVYYQFSSSPPQLQIQSPPSDQNYSYRQTYAVPRRSEWIEVKLTLNPQGVITSLSNTHSFNDGKSIRYQQNFESGIQAIVVGKNISDLNLDRVSGASETTKAFMSAISQIRSKL